MSVNLYQVAIPMILLAVVLMIVITVISNIQMSQRSSDIMSSIEASTSRYLNRYVSSLDEIYYALFEREENLEGLDKSLKGYIASNEEIKTIWILDMDGKTIAGTPMEMTKLGYDQSGHDFYKSLDQEGRVYWSDVFITHETNRPIVSVSKRFKNAIVVLQVDLEELTDFLGVFDITDNSYIAVTDQSGAYLAHSDYTFVKTRAYDPNRLDLLANKELTLTYNGKMMTAYHRSLQDINWSIIFYQSLWDLIMPIVIVVGLGMVLIVYISTRAIQALIKLNRDLSGDVNELVTWSYEIAKGNYNVKLNDSPIEEFHKLSNAFGLMTKAVLNREEELNKKRREISEINSSLEIEVKNRTKDLETSIADLKRTQNQLIHKEKMASLGSLVSGVAHELNTPIGVALTASTYLEEKNEQFIDRLMNEKISKNDLQTYVEMVNNSSGIIYRNMDRASELISSFKKVAIDQEKMHRESIHIKDIVDATVTSLSVEIKRHQVRTEVTYEGDLRCESYPGAISQVLTNLIQNSLVHAFGGVAQPEIKLSCNESDDGKNIEITYWDNGKGIEAEDLDRLYDPFYTTAQGSGGTGLGMNIVYTLLTGLLMGSIRYIENPNKGACFKMSIPKKVN